jgi:hypothetical protein
MLVAINRGVAAHFRFLPFRTPKPTRPQTFMGFQNAICAKKRTFKQSHCCTMLHGFRAASADH